VRIFYRSLMTALFLLASAIDQYALQAREYRLILAGYWTAEPSRSARMHIRIKNGSASAIDFDDSLNITGFANLEIACEKNHCAIQEVFLKRIKTLVMTFQIIDSKTLRILKSPSIPSDSGDYEFVPSDTIFRKSVKPNIFFSDSPRPEP